MPEDVEAVDVAVNVERVAALRVAATDEALQVASIAPFGRDALSFGAASGGLPPLLPGRRFRGAQGLAPLLTFRAK